MMGKRWWRMGLVAGAMLAWCGAGALRANESLQWAWLKGSSEKNQAGVYGTLGVAAPENVPGSREEAVAWTDGDGRLWLFGGLTYVPDAMNDLWRYDPATGNWTWMKGSSTGSQVGTYGTQGIPAPENTPGCRYSATSWTDADGNFWLFGGYGRTSGGWGFLNELWRYQPATGNWTWVKGVNGINQSGVYGTLGVADANNNPGSRYGAAGWADGSGGIWLFGGEGYDSAGASGQLNDLWHYSLTNGNWKWMGGNHLINTAGSYGPVTFQPGSRQWASAWTDALGKFWLFGGEGLDSTAASGRLNDLWQYDPDTGNWSLWSGSNLIDQSGVYGTQGEPDALNTPGARYGAVTWRDSRDGLWLAGGHGYDHSGASGFLSDLWRFNPAIGQWTWMDGSNNVNQTGTFGTQGVPDPANGPGGHRYATSWIDRFDNLWLFGGDGYDSAGTLGALQAMWRGSAIHTVVFRTDGTAGATVNGAAVVTDTVVSGSSTIAVTAATPRGHQFSGWIGGHVGVENPLTVATVTADLTITATFASEQVAVGKTFVVDAEDVGLDAFRAKPKVYATYVHPVTAKDGKATAKVLDKIDAAAGNGTIACEWTKKIRLCDLKAFKAAQAEGVGAADWITALTQGDLPMDLRLSGKETGDQPVYALRLAAPVITGIVDNGDGTWTITGVWLGKKKPKVWREYTIPPDVAVKRQNLKVVAPSEENTAHRDAKGKAACMDTLTGESQVIVVAPGDAKGPPNGTVVLDNGVGLAESEAPAEDSPLTWPGGRRQGMPE